MNQLVIAVALGVLLAHTAVSGQPLQPMPTELDRLMREQSAGEAVEYKPWRHTQSTSIAPLC
jgi:hypothetical protein